MNEKEADKLRVIANVLDDQYYDSDIDCTNKQSKWFHWAAQEIRKVIIDSEFDGITNVKCGTTRTYDITRTTWKPKEE